MKINCLYDALVPLHELKGHPRNPNKHPKDQLDRLAKVLAYQGWRYPVKVSKLSGFVTSGQGRIEAARLNGWETVPVNYQDYQDEAQEYADIVADNAIAEWADLDLSMINVEVPDFGPDFDADLLGIKDFEIEVADKYDSETEDETPEPPKEAKTKPGDVYILGNHRLMCGDSTNIQIVETLINVEKTDITFTSPPYNASKNGHLNGVIDGFENKYKQHNDALSDDDYLDLLNAFTSIAVLKSNYSFVNIQMLTHNRSPLFRYQHQHHELIKDVFIWNKKQCPPNIVKGAFNTKWEYVFCFSADNKTRGFPCDWRGQFPNVVETESNSNNEYAQDHKAGFPVALPVWFLEKFNFARSVYDPFGGTGTTLIACEKTNRKCFMMELDPHYVDVIVSRWCKYTGTTKVKLNGQEIDWETPTT